FLIALPVLIQVVLTLTGFFYAGIVLVAGSILFGSLALILSMKLKSSESFQVFNSFIFFIILFTSSVFYPTELAPEPIRIASLVNPLTYLADIFRAGLLGLIDPILGMKMGVLTAESLSLLILAVFLFNRIQV
ncbi:MAG: ABC transporter permease, partial [Nitrososphaerota archaeon]